MMKRYEYWSSEGKKFTTWFNWDSNLEEPWQLKNKLKNEFKNWLTMKEMDEYDKKESLLAEEIFQEMHKNMKK